MLSAIPNALTLSNLFCGCLSILFAFRSDFQTASYMIFIGAGFDFIDGFVARALKASSEIGKQLDSLSDVVTFGVAPSFLLYLYSNEWIDYPWANYAIFSIAIAASYRLAKFNTLTDSNAWFVGVPTPAIGILVASLPFSFYSFSPNISIGLALVLAFLMVSPFKFIALKFKSYGIKENIMPYLLILISILSIVFFNFAGIPIIIGSYIVISAINFYIL
jgi:CDP-diacylglycerol---serine O-phosphatidyltransferase